MESKNILIACIGNIFLGDDGFGCEVAKELQKISFPKNVKLFDFGIRGFDLANEIAKNYDLIIFVDAVLQNGKPGTLYLLEPDFSDLENPEFSDNHSITPKKALQLALSLGAKIKKVLIVGCQPENFGDEEIFSGLSENVQKAVNEAVKMVELIIEREKSN